MIIDFHTHVFPDHMAEKTIRLLASKIKSAPFTYGKLEQLQESMKAGNIDCSIVLPVVTRPEQFASVIDFAEQINQKYANLDQKVLSFGGIHPDSANYKGEISELVKRGFVGIKLHPDYQGVMFDDIRYMRIIEYAMEQKLIVSVHAGIDAGLPEPVHCKPKAAKKVIREIHPDRLVLAHYGGLNMWNEVEDELVGEDVYFDTAVIFDYIKEEQFIRILKNHGNDKILFASDSPWGGQKESVAAIQRMALTEDEKECIFYRNANSLLYGKNEK